MNTTRLIRPAAFLLAAAILTGSAYARKPAQPLSYPYTEAKVITLLPILDARNDKKARVNLDNLRNDALKGLKRKRYQVARGTQTAAMAGLTVDDLKEAAPDLIRRFGTTEDRWVMVLCLNDVASKVTFGSTGNAEMTGFLFDKQSGKLAWMHKGIGQAGQGGLIGIAMKPSMNGAALSAAMWQVLATIPNQPKPK